MKRDIRDVIEWLKIVGMGLALVGGVLIVVHFDPHAFESNAHRTAVALERLANK